MAANYVIEGLGVAKESQARPGRIERIETGSALSAGGAAQKGCGAGLLIDKVVVNWQDQAMELGRRLNWDAMREGLGAS